MIFFSSHQELSTQIAESDSNKLDHDSTQDKSEEKADGETENQVRSFMIIKSLKSLFLFNDHIS